MLFELSGQLKTYKRLRFVRPVQILLVHLRCAETHAHDAAPPSDHFNRSSDFALYEITDTQNGRTQIMGGAPRPNEIPLNAITSVDTTRDRALFAFEETVSLVTSIRA